ncbi:MAG: probable iron binding protein from the HesB_IscA_SufA family, partial [uncultured Gemmatimonadetes bacterium]
EHRSSGHSGSSYGHGGHRGAPLHRGAGRGRDGGAARGRAPRRLLGLSVRPEHRGRGRRRRHDPGVAGHPPVRGSLQPAVPAGHGDRLRVDVPGERLHLQQPERRRRLRLRELVHGL